MKLGGRGDHSSKVKTIAFFLFYWNHFSKNYIQQTPSTGLGSSLCLKDHNSSGRQNCRWLLVGIVLHKFLVFLLHTLEVLSRSRSGSGSSEFLSLIHYCGTVTHFVSRYSVAPLMRAIQKLHQWGFPHLHLWQDQRPLWEEGGMWPGLSPPAHDSPAALI